MATAIINGKITEVNQSLEVINGQYFVDGEKVGNDEIDHLIINVKDFDDK